MNGAATEHTINPLSADSSRSTDIITSKAINRLRQHNRVWKVELMSRAVNRIDLDRSFYVEPSLFKPKAKPASSCEKVNSDWSHVALSPTIFFQRVVPM